MGRLFRRNIFSRRYQQISRIKIVTTLNSIGLNAVLEAQAQSAARAKVAAQTAAINAPAFAQLEEKGIQVKTVDFAQLYKQQVLKDVDTNGDGMVSEAELEQEVQSGGGTQAQATALYKAMDMNGDGSVSAQEFENSIPFSMTDFEKQRDAMLQMLKNGDAPSGGSFDPLIGISPQSIDPAQILGNLASGLA
jgi:hypothetical protein